MSISNYSGGYKFDLNVYGHGQDENKLKRDRVTEEEQSLQKERN